MALNKTVFKNNLQTLLSTNNGNSVATFCDQFMQFYTTYINAGLFIHSLSVTFTGGSTVSASLKTALGHTNPNATVFVTALANGLTTALAAVVIVPTPNYVLVALPPTGGAALISGLVSDLTGTNSYAQAATKITDRLDLFTKTLSATVTQLTPPPPVVLPPEFLA